MSKSDRRTVFVCQQCGKESLKWLGRCPDCQEWNSFAELTVAVTSSALRPLSQTSPPQQLSEVSTESADRFPLPISEFNRVLGGGLVGCMAALRARKNKNMDVAIVERGTIRWGGNAIGFDDYNLEHPGIIEHPIPRDFSAKQAEKGSFGAKRFFNLISSNLAVTEAKNYVKPIAVLDE